MDALDRSLLNILQDGIDICGRPFATVADRHGISEADISSRVTQMLDDGYLSRFGPMYDAEKMGGAVTLCAMQVPVADFETVADIVNAFPEVAHNYERDHDLNMWFVVATADADELPVVLERIGEVTGLTVYNMPKLDEFYIGLRLDAGAQ